MAIETTMDWGKGYKREGGEEERYRKKEPNQNAMCSPKISWCYVLNTPFENPLDALHR